MFWTRDSLNDVFYLNIKTVINFVLLIITFFLVCAFRDRCVHYCSLDVYDFRIWLSRRVAFYTLYWPSTPAVTFTTGFDNLPSKLLIFPCLGNFLFLINYMSQFFPFLIDRFRTVDTWIQMWVKNGFLT